MSRAGRIVAEEPPHHILFLRDLPADTTQMMLTVLFQQFQGFKEARLAPGPAGTMVAFVEFESEAQAVFARQNLQGFKITPTSALNINFAKK